MDLEDDWCPSAAELDSLEEEALRKVAERKSSSQAASCSSPLPPRPPHAPSLSSNTPHPLKANLENRCARVEALSPTSKVLERDGKSDNDKMIDAPKLSVRLFLHACGDIAAKFPYHPMLVEAFHRIPKATWHAKERLWMFQFSSLPIAEKVLKGISNVEVQMLDSLVTRAISAAMAAPDFGGLYDKMPSSIQSELLPFQRDGVRFVLQHGGRALLADEMGLGKTLQAIAVSSCMQNRWPVLVLTPSSLRLHWASMIHQWLDIPPSDILVVMPQHGGSNKAGFTIAYSSSKGVIRLNGVFNIISYDVVPKLQDLLIASEFRIVIADESHFLKNARAKRTIASLPILQRAAHAILLTGTPALSRPIELYKQLEALYPNVYNDVHEYGKRYCKGGIFGLYQGASNCEELHNLMKATVMIRRLKKDVLAELPMKRRQQVLLDLKEKDLIQIRALFCELEVVKNNIQARDSVEQIESLKILQKNIINKIYTCSAEAKIPAVLDYLGTVVEAGCKFLIFAHHQPMIDSIHQFLRKKKINCIRIDGSTASSMRQALVADFQEKDDVLAAVLSIKAGGVGLTLTAASTVIFAELSWNPGDIIQAEDRAHRIGQASSVNVYYLLANDTVDDIIWDVLHSKLENLGQVLDGHDCTLETTFNKVNKSPLKAPSPYKQAASPSKQTRLDTYLKRCEGDCCSEQQSKLKILRK